MLTSSPIAPRSTSASPRTFHYAPHSLSPHLSPKVTANLPRRQSKHSIVPSQTASLGLVRSPPHSQLQHSKPKQYVGVDAATQHSPMEPFDPTVPVRNARPSPPSDALPSASSAATKNAVANASAPAASSILQSQSQSQSATPQEPPEPNLSPNRPENVHSAANPLSPAKRRNSQELAKATSSFGMDGAAATSSNGEAKTSPKRSRTDQGPVKVLPLRYELCEVEDMVILIANMLSELIETNDSLAMKSGHLTRFHSRTAPGISVLDYLHRLAKHATLTPPLLLSMVYYIDRLCALYSDFTINTLTVHRFLITAATVAGKGLSDSFWNNSFYARVGGVKVAELKLLELEFLYRVDWKIIPNPEVLVAYYKGLVERCDGYTLQKDEASNDDADDGDEGSSGGFEEESDGIGQSDESDEVNEMK
ncbi:putative Nuc-1 negative regulatory protein preg [Seiridium cardinale]